MIAAPIPTLPHAEYARFESMSEYEVMLDELITGTQRVIRIFDQKLTASYNTAGRCARLREFLRANPLNRIDMVVHEAEGLNRLCPRLVMLLQQFGHVIKLRQTSRAAKHLYDPFVIFDASHYLHRFHHEQMRYARGLDDVEGAKVLLDRYAELWEASTPVTASSVTGL